MSQKINIAIDGYAGCGKSTTARLAARELGYAYIDTGAMYRAVALHFLRNNIPVDRTTPEMLQALEEVEIVYEKDPETGMFCVSLNGQCVENEIRLSKVSNIVSAVSVHQKVRELLVAQQKAMASKKSVVMDGRDIGTVVLPDAELKVFMSASMEIRAVRRQEELRVKGIDISVEEIRENLESRDRIDSGRAISPLKQADDAIIIDTSYLGIVEQVAQVVKLAKDLIG